MNAYISVEQRTYTKFYAIPGKTKNDVEKYIRTVNLDYIFSRNAIHKLYRRFNEG